MNNPCKCKLCANQECIINILGELGFKIVTGYYLSMDEPEWQDLSHSVPEIIDCKDFIGEEIKRGQ